MNSRSSILLACTFACGFLCGWLNKSVDSPSPPEETFAKRESRPPRRVNPDRRESSAILVNANARVDMLLDLGKDWQPGSNKDIPRPPGFKDMMISWYDSDPDQMLSWVLSIGNVKDQKELMELIVARCAKDDWRGAVEMASLYRNTTGGRIYIPSEVKAEIGKLAPEEFARISQLFAPLPHSWTYEFGDDFQFRETLELLGSEYRHYSLFEEWARRDLGAAWEWTYAHIQSPTQIRGMAEAWSEGASHDEVAEFAALLMDESNWDPETARRRNWSREQWRVEHKQIVSDMLMSRPSPETFQSLLEQVPNRQETLNDLLRSNLHLNIASARRYREELLNQMTAAERITAFESIDPDFIARENIRRNFEGILTLLGHSREEIDWMVPAANSQ